jgi:acyl dehydratase
MLYFEDFNVGRSWESEPVSIDRESIIRFGREFDPQPFHTGGKPAVEPPFGELIASGWHTGSIGMRHMVDCFLGNSASVGGPGLDYLKWPNPVYPDDILRTSIAVLEARISSSRPALGLVKFNVIVRKQDLRPAVEMVPNVFIARRLEGSPI